MSLFFYVFLSSTNCDVFCRRLVTMGSCVIDFMGFRVDSSNNEVQSDRVIRSNLARQYIAYLKFWYIRFFLLLNVS